MNQQKDIIIIGGGIIGVSVAYYLAKQGRAVTLIEKGDIGKGSSYGNAGLIANGFAIPLAVPGVPLQGLKWMFDATSPFYIKPRLNFDLLSWLLQFTAACTTKQMRQSVPTLLSLGQGSFDLFNELFAQEDVDFGYENKGRLIIFTSEKSFEKWMSDVALVREFGVNVSLLDARGVRQIEPHVLPSVTHGIFSESYAHVNPALFVQAMTRLAKNQGVEMITGTAVTGFEKSGHQITSLATTNGTFTPNQVVLAAGAWSPLIARELKLRIPIQPAKGYSLTYKRPPTSPKLPLQLAERKIAVTPMGELLRFTSTLELAGFDPSINERRLDGMRQSIKEYLPGTDTLEHESAWSGFRPATPDDLPIIGRSDRFENLVLATGHGSLGITHGLITGKLVSQIMVGERPSIDLSPLRANRF